MSVIREEDRLTDIRKKISIIKTIIQKCNHLTNNPVELASPLAATMFLTNESAESIEKVLRNPKTRVLRSLLESYQDMMRKSEKSKIFSCQIHEFLFENYVNERRLLKLQDVKSELKKLNVVENQLEVLKRAGYIWKKLRGDKCILVEDPEVQAKRMKYMLDIKRFREDNRIFVFVDDKTIPADLATLSEFQKNNQFPESGKFNNIKIAISPQLGVLALSVNHTSESFTDWLNDEVTPHLRESFVLVMNGKIIKESPINQPPNPEAKKEDMVNWLERNDIPCSTAMHRAKLYELIDTFKDKLSGEITITDAVFKAKGVELLKTADGWPVLNYFAPLWNMKDIWNPIKDGDIVKTLEKRIQMVVFTWSLEKFLQYTTDIEYLYEKDMELEEVVDKLFTMARDVDIPDADLTNYWEVEGNNMEKYVNIVSGALDPAAKK